MTAIVLRDSAHLQEEDAAYANQAGFARHDAGAAAVRRRRRGPHAAAAPPGPAPRGGAGRGGRHGHLARGRAHPRLGQPPGGRRRARPCCSRGDLGRAAHPVVPDREDPAAADVVVIGVDVRRPGAPCGRLGGARRRRSAGPWGAAARCSCPAFAVDRTEVVLVALGELMRSGRIPTVPVYVDSPMAVAALEVYRRVPGASSRSGSRPSRRPDRGGVADPQRPGATLHRDLGVRDGHRRTGAAPPRRHAAGTRQQRRADRLPGRRDPRARPGRGRPPGEDPRPVRAGARRGRPRPGVLRARRLRRDPRLAGAAPRADPGSCTSCTASPRPRGHSPSASLQSWAGARSSRGTASA